MILICDQDERRYIAAMILMLAKANETEPKKLMVWKYFHTAFSKSDTVELREDAAKMLSGILDQARAMLKPVLETKNEHTFLRAAALDGAVERVQTKLARVLAQGE